MKISEIKPDVWTMAEKAEGQCRAKFAEIDKVAEKNTLRVMEAFQDNKVSDSCFAGTTGYGYDDLGRDTLDKIYAQLFGTEAALVRIGFVNGTHAISSAMFSLVKPGDTILSVTGTPYDTIRPTIGIEGSCHGSLKFYGIKYDEVPLLPNGDPDYEGIRKACADPKVTAVMIQRSIGYDVRRALSVTEIGKICSTIKSVNPKINIMVDNCYGEFVETIEPSHVGAELVVGSLIKNPGGGLAPTGGYLAGKAELIENAAFRMTTPGIGGECGATMGNNRLMFQGLFMAPHVVAQALKTAVFCAAMMEQIGIECYPRVNDSRADIIELIKMRDPEKLKKFCAGIQAGAPVDSYLTPEPSPMPGYNCPVIMAAGAFVQGASIELSADGPMREPYIAYLQGGITYESGKLGIMMAVSCMLSK